MENTLGDFLHFRVHVDTLDLDKLMEFLKEQTVLHFACREFAAREHIHACLKLKCAKQTFIDRLKKKFPTVVGNGNYSLGKLKTDYDNNARYCYKGKANDYPDIIYTIHTKEEWLRYYNEYWEIFKKLHPPPPPVGDLVVKTKAKAKTFMVKLRDTIFEDYPGLPPAIWSYYGYKNDTHCPTDLDTYSKCLEYLAEVLYTSLGKAVKNIDDMIFERLFRGLLASILVECPDKNICKTESKKLLDKFRNKL